MNELDQVLSAATKAIDSTYFTISIAGGPSVFRERVYCYELYHQMRLLWPNGCEYMLTGELDKRAHPILTQLGAASKQPDLLVHQPGNMNENFAVIEVKHSTALDGIRKDLDTLNLFLQKVRYKRAIYLVYGDLATKDTDARITKCAMDAGITTPIEIWLQPDFGTAAVRHSVIG